MEKANHLNFLEPYDSQTASRSAMYLLSCPHGQLPTITDTTRNIQKINAHKKIQCYQVNFVAKN